MATVTITADKVIAENSIKLQAKTVTGIVTTLVPLGSDDNLATEKAIISFIAGITGKVLISANDSTPEYLYDKIDLNGGLLKTTSADGNQNETLHLENTIRTIVALEDVGFATEPTSDKILYYDSTAGKWAQLAIGINLTIDDGVLNGKDSSGTAVEYRADKVTTDANTSQNVVFSSQLGTVDANVIVMVNSIDASGNVVIPTITNISTQQFTLETATASTSFYQAFIKS